MTGSLAGSARGPENSLDERVRLPRSTRIQIMTRYFGRNVIAPLGIAGILVFAIDIDLVRMAVADPNGLACEPVNNFHGTKGTPIAYAKMIEPALGVPPRVDCGANVEMPVYVDGVQSIGDPGLHKCDNPSLQIGDCMSGSSVGRYEGLSANGEPLPHVVWVSFCRHDGRDDVVGYDMPDSVQMIGYNTVTGATAFFESGKNSDYTYVDPKTNRLLGELPGVDEPEAFNIAYATPGRTQCVACHQSDPFVHNAFIDGARLEHPGSQPVVPNVTGRKRKSNPPYYVIGGSDWDMRTIRIAGNGCFGCHRIGMKTVEEFVGDHWDPNKHMPPNDQGSLAEDYKEVVQCWLDGPENTPGCDWIVPPAGNCPRQVVGDDYPYKAAFNRPKLKDLR